MHIIRLSHGAYMAIIIEMLQGYISKKDSTWISPVLSFEEMNLPGKLQVFLPRVSVRSKARFCFLLILSLKRIINLNFRLCP